MDASVQTLPGGLPRETAEDQGGAPAPRLLTEQEAYAISAANVLRETADAKAANAKLETEKAELQTKLDTAEATVITEKARADKAETDLTEAKTAHENEKAAAARVDERVAKVKETAGHLTEEYFTDDRKQRWAAMSDEDFTATIAELAELTKGLAPVGAPAGGAAPAGGGAAPPKETAMQGAPAGGGDAPTTGNAGKLLAFQRGA